MSRTFAFGHYCVCAVAVAMAALGADAWADDVCSQQEHRAADATLAQARAAETAGDLTRALQLASDSNARFCGSGTTSQDLISRVTLRLGNEMEAAGKLAKAFEYFEAGGHFAEAKRVGLAQLKAAPADRSLAEKQLYFMRNHEFQDGVSQILAQARSQAQRLLAEEEKTFAIRTPHRDLLDAARDWLRVAGDEEAASVKKRAAARGDQLAALDYPYALEEALSYYSMAGRPDGEATVRAKAGRLAAQKAGGDQWAEAVKLYEIAGDDTRANALREQREAQAQKSEEVRKQTFDKDQDALEKELGF